MKLVLLKKECKSTMGDQISQTSYIRKNTLENYFLLSPLLENISEQSIIGAFIIC